MSAGQTLPPACSPFPAGPAGGLRGSDPHGSPQAEMESLRRFVNERLTAAVDDILGVFVETVARYREQIDHQRRQLDNMRTAQGKRSRAAGLPASPSHDPLQVSSWIKKCPDEQVVKIQLEQTDSTEEISTIISAAQIKTEAGGDCGALEPSDDFDPACGSEGADDVGLLAESSETEDSEDCWREAAGLWKREETEEAEEQSSSQTMTVKNSTHQPPPVFSCKVCGKPFQRISYLLTHARAHSTDCGLCGKHLGQIESLKLHLRVHREASFRCGVCGQSFTLRGNLRIHMMIHSGERPYGCTVCGKSFGRRATLVRHVRGHTGEKPFTCTYCGRGFVEKGNLTVHLRTHTGERPYWCSACDRRFSQLSCFYKHPCQRRDPPGDRAKT